MQPKATSLLLQAHSWPADWNTPSKAPLAKLFPARDTSDHSKGGISNLSDFSPTPVNSRQERNILDVREQGEPHLLQRTKSQNRVTDNFSCCAGCCIRSAIGRRAWLMFGRSYSHCSVLFSHIVVPDSFRHLIPQKLNYTVSPLTEHWNYQQLHHDSIISQDK